MAITNFRDLGGIKNKDGQLIKRKKFLRSGELFSVTEKEQEKLIKEYHVKLVVDFRSEEEVQKRPNQLLPDFEYIHIDIVKERQEEGASLEDFIQVGSAKQAVEYMQKLYWDIALDNHAKQGYDKFLNSIIDLPEKCSILFHCFAGKDRTGIAAALLLELLDVPRETIVQDYLLTNQLRKKENQTILTAAKASEIEVESLAALEVALNVDKSYLDNFYRAIEDHYGDISTYLRQEIGISNALKKNLKDKFLVIDE